MLFSALLFSVLLGAGEGQAEVKIKARSLGRHPEHGVNYANFKAHTNSYLAVKKVGVVLVYGLKDCGVACVNHLSCFSFNIAISSNKNGHFLCELLATDKYNASRNFGASGDFHHFSIATACRKDPCKNGATCAAKYEKDTYTCICVAGYAGNHCEIDVNDCAPGPCNHGSCTDLVNGFRCTCDAGWTGKSCDTKIRPTCSQVKLRNPSASSGSYLIDPDGSGGVATFSVYCDMTDKGGVGVTVISHDTESKTLVDGYRDPGSYMRNVRYQGATAQQLAKLTLVSTSCEQFIKYECFHSRLRRHDMGWWVSRDGTKMNNWGGAPEASNKCACGVTVTCAKPSYMCNCDKNDNIWRSDSGFLTSKDKLPVIQLRFGDTGYSLADQGYYTLGKLRCYG